MRTSIRVVPPLQTLCIDRSVYLLRDYGGDKQSQTPTASHLRLSRRKDDSETGDIAWGLGVQSDKLFASSMTKEEKAFGGTHRIYDVLTERVACTLRLEEAGDSIAVHPTGMDHNTIVHNALYPQR